MWNLIIIVAVGLLIYWWIKVDVLGGEEKSFSDVIAEHRLEKRERKCFHLACAAVRVVQRLGQGGTFDDGHLKISAAGKGALPRGEFSQVRATIAVDGVEVLRYAEHHWDDFYKPGEWEHLLARLESSARLRIWDYL